MQAAPGRHPLALGKKSWGLDNNHWQQPQQAI